MAQLGLNQALPMQLLRGLNPSLHSMAVIIKTQFPLPSFLQVCSLLALEEEAELRSRKPSSTTGLLASLWQQVQHPSLRLNHWELDSWKFLVQEKQAAQ